MLIAQITNSVFLLHDRSTMCMHTTPSRRRLRHAHHHHHHITAQHFSHIMRIFIMFQKGGNAMRISLCFSDRRVFLRRISLKCLRRNSALKKKFREKISLCRVSLQLNLQLRHQKKLDVLWEISLKSKLKVGKKTF